jgi:hypothetical protein
MIIENLKAWKKMSSKDTLLTQRTVWSFLFCNSCTSLRIPEPCISTTAHSNTLCVTVTRITLRFMCRHFPPIHIQWHKNMQHIIQHAFTTITGNSNVCMTQLLLFVVCARNSTSTSKYVYRDKFIIHINIHWPTVPHRGNKKYAMLL